MPKKAKAKGGAASHPKSDEVKNLKAARDRLEQQLDIKSTQMLNLQEEYQRSQDLVNNMERRLRKETDSLRQELHLKVEENASIVEELQFELQTQREKMKLYQSQLHAAEVVVTENELLRKRVSNLNAILQARSSEHAATIHNMNSDRFNIRLQLEQAFRKALEEAKEKSQEDALEAMSEQSKKAIQLNRELTSELQTQSRGIRKMCEHYDLTDAQLKAVKLQSSLNESQIKATTAELTRLARRIQQQKMTIEEKDKALLAAEEARATAEAQAAKLKTEVETNRATLVEKEKYIQTMQSRIYYLSNKLSKLTSRRSAAGRRQKTSRQQQLLSQSGELPSLSRAQPQTPEVSNELSRSFPQVAADNDRVESEFDPAFIWNADLHNSVSPRARSSPLLSVSYTNKDPIFLNGKRSNRTTNSSSQFVP